jgi:hypothetical protein
MKQPSLAVLTVSGLPFPSHKYYYETPGGIIAEPVSGTSDEIQTSYQIWYSMRSKQIYSLTTVYASTIPAQTYWFDTALIDYKRSVEYLPSSVLALSLKSQKRQYPDGGYWLYNSYIQQLVGKNVPLDKIIRDYYLFPPHPSADILISATLTVDYHQNGDDSKIRKYLADRSVEHLVGANLNYFPPYYLYFLLTRYFSYPISENKIKLAELRSKVKINSPEQIIIDSVYENKDITSAVTVIHNVMVSGPDIMLKTFDTQNKLWYLWADEYITSMNMEPIEITNFEDPISEISSKLFTWSDNKIAEIACNIDGYNEEKVIRKYPTRLQYIQTIANFIQRSPKIGSITPTPTVA